MKACFTGHRFFREEEYWHYQDGANQLIDIAIQEFEIDYFINGMCIGADLAAAGTLVKRKLNWQAIIPCADQWVKWGKLWQRRYNLILSLCPSKVVLHEKFVDGCMHQRNQKMIKESDVCLAMYNNKQEGGTYWTVQMAVQANKQIIQWNPETDKITVWNHQPKLF